LDGGLWTAFDPPRLHAAWAVGLLAAPLQPPRDPDADLRRPI